ncbi:MAG: chemotaxis protein CheD [bacterium]|nr:chemotaxis protein CheD [bacterium]
MQHNVRIAEIKIAKRPDELVCILGSCVGVCLWDPNNGLGGLVHIMMPESNEDKREKGKYADTGVKALVEKMEIKGSRLSDIVAKIYGGASMFSMTGKKNTLNIGERNIEAVKKSLKEIGIPVVHEELGGTTGRKIIFNLDTGKVEVRQLK